MLGRLFIGIAKGVLVGVLLSLALTQLGAAAPGALLAYPAAAIAGVLVGLIAGKPIWAGDAKIEAGLKAFVGALVGVGFMVAARRWLTMPMPLSLGMFSAPNTSLGEVAGTHGTLGGLALTSLCLVAAIIGAFYEIDNEPSESPPKRPTASSSEGAKARGPRVASAGADPSLEEDLEDEADKKRAQK